MSRDYIILITLYFLALLITHIGFTTSWTTAGVVYLLGSLYFAIFLLGKGEEKFRFSQVWSARKRPIEVFISVVMGIFWLPVGVVILGAKLYRFIRSLIK